MNLFHLQALAAVVHEIEEVEAGCFMQKILGQGGALLNEPVARKAEKSLEFADNLFTIYPMANCLDHVKTARVQRTRPMVDASAEMEIFHRLTVDLLDSLKGVEALQIASDRRGLVDKDDLFGPHVKTMFASAQSDIKEAGNCLATECNTGAVFHLMRASEIALRVLARDRNVVFKDKPLEQKQWGELLGALEGIVKDLREGDGKRWAKQETREIQIRFYNEVLQEFRAFNEAWRKHLSHARADSFYDRDYAMSVFTHVRTFMQKLATKIGENTITPEFWP